MKMILNFENETKEIIFNNGIDIEKFNRILGRSIAKIHGNKKIISGNIELTENSFYENESCMYYNKLLKTRIHG